MIIRRIAPSLPETGLHECHQRSRGFAATIVRFLDLDVLEVPPRPLAPDASVDVRLDVSGSGLGAQKTFAKRGHSADRFEVDHSCSVAASPPVVEVVRCPVEVFVLR